MSLTAKPNFALKIKDTFFSQDVGLSGDVSDNTIAHLQKCLDEVWDMTFKYYSVHPLPLLTAWKLDTCIGKCLSPTLPPQATWSYVKSNRSSNHRYIFSSPSPSPSSSPRFKCPRVLRRRSSQARWLLLRDVVLDREGVGRVREPLAWVPFSTIDCCFSERCSSSRSEDLKAST